MSTTVNVAFHGTLVATTVQTIILNDARDEVVVYNRSGTTEIYFTVASSGVVPTAPTVGGNDCYVVPAVAWASFTVQAGSPPVTVSLISSGTPTFSVVAGQALLVNER